MQSVIRDKRSFEQNAGGEPEQLGLVERICKRCVGKSDGAVRQPPRGRVEGRSQSVMAVLGLVSKELKERTVQNTQHDFSILSPASHFVGFLTPAG